MSITPCGGRRIIDIQDQISAEIRRLAAEYAEQVDEACERALVTGTMGVRVVRRFGRVVSAEPDPGVPYGCIHEQNEWQ